MMAVIGLISPRFAACNGWRSARHCLLAPLAWILCFGVGAGQGLGGRAQVNAAEAFDTPITALAFSPEGRELLVGTTHQLIRYHWPSLQVVERIAAPRTYDLQFSPDGQTLLLAGGSPAQSGTVTVVKYGPGLGKPNEIELHTDVVYAVAWSPDGRHFATAGADGECHVVADAGDVSVTFRGHSRPVLAVVYLDHEWIASAGVDQTIQIWNATTGEHRRTLNNHVGAVNGLLRVPQKSGRDRLVSIGQDRTIRIWEPMIGRLVRFERTAEVPQRVTRGASDGRVRVVTRSGQLLTADESLTHWDADEQPAQKSVRPADPQPEVQSPAPQPGEAVVYALAVEPQTGRTGKGRADGVLWVEPED